MTNNASVSPEFERFRQTFFDECAELLLDAEERLQQLETQADPKEDIDAIFRCVHSIKAGAGAFNYARVVTFAHRLEALLDQLRDGRLMLSAPLIHLVVQAIDALNAMVSAAQSGRDLETGFETALFDALDKSGSKEADGAPSHAVTPQNGAADDDDRAEKQWRIAFTPKPEMLRNANEPLLLVRELKSLGAVTTTCFSDRLPPLSALEPEDAYLYFVFDLISPCALEAIKEVFEFVDLDCTLEIEIVNAPAKVAEVADTPTQTFAEAPPVKTQANATAAKAGQAQASIRVDLDRVDRLVNMVGELVIAQSMLRQEITTVTQASDHDDRSHSAIEGLEHLEALTREMQDCVMAIRMQPVKSVFSRLPRLVREVAAKLGKAVRLDIVGELTELDKTVIEELADPLIHMIRNSVDHGLEMPDVRRAAGKPEEGVIRVSAAHIGSNILIHIEDDGAGINRARVFAKAVEKAIIAPDARLTDDEVLELIFAPGFSTAQAVTDVSGRGVGMDVVRRNILKIGGRIHIASTEGKGSRFSLVIPLTLAVLDGMLLGVGRERYILPLTSIIESFCPTGSMINHLVGGDTVINVRGTYHRLIRLHQVFDVAGAQQDVARGLVILVETASGARVCLLVDELLGQQQVVIKSLQDNYRSIEGVSGATILGDGRVALILDMEQLNLCRTCTAPQAA
jgi:two-component system chemotaxis sensor kinase CheA